MYVTRTLSHYKKFPDSLSAIPDGPNSGYLVILDEEAESYYFFGLCKNHRIKNLPFPQNKNLNTRYSTGAGKNSDVSYDDVVLIPVLNQPPSSNRYYAIKPHGSHKGEAYACSRDEDMATGCFCSCISDIKPRPFNPKDIYQQYEISLYRSGTFNAKSISPDGYPPHFLRRKGWEIYTKTPKNYELSEAQGLNATLRSQLPQFSTPLSNQKRSEAVVVGKWYCPFVFIKDGSLDNQMRKSMYYEMTLTQNWEQIFSCENNYGEGNRVTVDVGVEQEVVLVGGKVGIWDEKKVINGVIWFYCYGIRGEEGGVGLCSEIVERMKWEEERGGWVRGEDRVVRVKRNEEFGGVGGWTKYGCYVLVERFVLKRMDGSLVMTYEFKHTHQIKSMWE